MSLRLAAVVLVFVALLSAMRVSAPPAQTQRVKPLRLREICVKRVERRHIVRFTASDGVPPNLCGWLPYARALAAAGYRVLVFDHRGFGSSGSTSRRSRANRVDFDVLGAIRTLRARGVQSIVLGGASLGGAAVLGAAAL